MKFWNPFSKTQKAATSPQTPSQEPARTVAMPQSPEGSKMIGADASDVIVKPLISEKSAALASGRQYAFVVRKGANRLEVRRAVKQMYGVSPLSVNILNVRGKQMRFGRRAGSRSDWKKAIVTLPEGQVLNVYEGV